MANPEPFIAAAAFLSLLLSSACAPGSTADTSQALAVNAQRQALEVADGALAANVEDAGLVEGVWPFLADDAVFLEPGLDIVKGRDAVRAALEAVPPASPVTFRLHRISSGQSGDGDLGYTFGWIEIVPDAGTTTYGKYVAMWRLYTGHWRLEAFVRSSGVAPPAPPADGVLAGWHGVLTPGDPGDLAEGVANADSAFSALAEAESTCVAFPTFADEHAIVFGGANFYYGSYWVQRAYGYGCTTANGASWAPVYSASTASGDLGWSTGNATFSHDDGTAVTYTYSKYLTVWVRQADGGWKWMLDAGSARPAPYPHPAEDLRK